VTVAVQQAADIVALAFDPAVETPSDPLSERVLDAALSLAVASGVRNLTMDDVAKRARVGRMTVYRRFGDKARLIEAMSVREARSFLGELNAAVRPDAPVVEQIADGFVAGLRLVRSNPLLNRLSRNEPESVLETLNADGGALVALGREFLVQHARAAGIAGPDADEAAEVLVRMGVSFALLPDTVFPLHDEERLRELARRLFAPLVGVRDA
jgi:AcrR family transcriptional regulator